MDRNEEDEDGDSDCWRNSRGAYATGKEELRHAHQQRRDAHGRLVDTLRWYGMFLLGAVVLLPSGLVVVAVFSMALAYVMAKYAQPRNS